MRALDETLQAENSPAGMAAAMPVAAAACANFRRVNGKVRETPKIMKVLVVLDELSGFLPRKRVIESLQKCILIHKLTGILFPWIQ